MLAGKGAVLLGSAVPRFQPDLKPWDVKPETRALAELCLVLLNSSEFLYVY